MINRRKDIFEADEIKKVIDFLKVEKTITNITESSGISTIYSSSLILLNDNAIIYLIAGQVITINKVNYEVIAVNLTNNTFTITATGLFHMTTGTPSVKVLDVTKWNIAINFKVGSRIEINELLALEQSNPDYKLQRFPLIWLFINESEKTSGIEFDHKTTLKMAFAHLNNKVNDRVLGRIDNSLETILQPLLTLFEATIRSPYFSRVFSWDYMEYDKTKYNRFFYGSSDKNEMVLTSPTDAIEVEIDLTFQNQY
jgi:hypothetical protein